MMKLQLAEFSTQILFHYCLQSISASPLQIDIPTLFDSPLSNPTALVSLNATLRDAYPCFDPTALVSLNAILRDAYPCFDPSPDLRPTNHRDCDMAIMEMPRRTDSRVYTFGRGSHVTDKLPRDFQHGTCFVSLDMIYDDQVDELTFSEIRAAAIALALRCTTGSVFNLGGVAVVRPRNVLHITIMGVAAPDRC